MQVMPGASLTLSCGFTGNPLPTITWGPQGGGVVNTANNRSVLTVQDVRRGNGGVHRCTATNTEGNSSSDFTVEGEPHPPPTP